MKTKLIKTTLLGLTVLGTLALASCQAPKCQMPTHAVSCDKCHTIHFKAPAEGGVGTAGSKGGIVTLRDASSMSCPDCEKKVVAMLKGGAITRHTCSSCGGTLSHCMQH